MSSSLSDQYARLPLAKILITRDSRQRRDIDTAGLIESIAARGVIQPIIVEAGWNPAGTETEYRLVAGERRFAASVELGLPDIPVRFASDLSPIERQIIELEENLKRKDLPWQDQVAAMLKIHALRVADVPTWTARETASALGISDEAMSVRLQVARHLDDSRIAGAKSITEAINILRRREQRLNGDALEELLTITKVPVEPPAVTATKANYGDVFVFPPGENIPFRESNFTDAADVAVELPFVIPPAFARPELIPEERSILNVDFIEWVTAYAGPKFNFIHCDFPYGVNLFDGHQGTWTEPGKHFSDTKETYEHLLTSFCIHLDKFMSLSGHLMFWHSAKHRGLTENIFAKLAPSLDFHTYDLIWVRSDSSGIVSDHRRKPRHIYETCLVASRGDRHIVKIKSDAYSAPADRTLHASTKPEPMLRHFMEMFVDEGTTLLDPTCGSGAALRAAESLGAKHVLGLEIDPEACGVARKALKSFRLLRV